MMKKRRREENGPVERNCQRGNLENTGLFLQPPDIFHDVIDVFRCNAVDLRHVPEFPMVRLDAVGCSPLEGRIPVMIWLVDLMHQRRSVVGPRRLLPMAGCTVRVEFGFAHLELSRYRTAPHRLFWLRGVAGHEEAHYQQPDSKLRP